MVHDDWPRHQRWRRRLHGVDDFKVKVAHLFCEGRGRGFSGMILEPENGNVIILVQWLSKQFMLFMVIQAIHGIL